MTDAVSYDVRRIGVQPRKDDPRLPDPTPDIDLWKKPILDRIGESVARRPWIVAPAALAGAIGSVAAMRLRTHSALLQVAAGVAGALTGAAIGGWGSSKINDTLFAPTRNAANSLPTPHVSEHEKLRVMTYNIRGGIGQTGFGADKESLDAIANEIAQQNPDIVLLQEVDDFSARSSWVDNIAEIRERLHPNSVASADTGRLKTGRSESVAIMTFHGNRITDARNIVHADPDGSSPLRRALGTVGEWLRAEPIRDHVPDFVKDSAGPSYTPANTLDVMIKTVGGNNLRALTAHYMGPNKDRDYQALEIGGLVQQLKQWDGPTIVAADFNVASGGKRGAKEVEYFKSVGLKDAFTIAGIAADNREERESTVADRNLIDRIYVPENSSVSAAQVVRNTPAASDHYPVVADIELNTKR